MTSQSVCRSAGLSERLTDESLLGQLQCEAAGDLLKLVLRVLERVDADTGLRAACQRGKIDLIGGSVLNFPTRAEEVEKEI